jgi:copper chaperone CopZ
MSGRKQIVLRVEGMTCDGCAHHVTAALQSVPGVLEAHHEPKLSRIAVRLWFPLYSLDS